MDGDLKTLDERVLVRRCVVCGDDAPSLQNGSTDRCGKCGCDLLERPPRSYAEMEGLLDPPDAADDDRDILSPRRQEKLLHRWLAFLFFTLLAMMAMLSLASKAFSA